MRAARRIDVRRVAEHLAATGFSANSDLAAVHTETQRRLIEHLAEALGGIEPPIADRAARRAFDSLLADVDSPLLRLSETYETLLALSPARTSAGRFALRADAAQRRRAGAYYTPWWIANEVARAAIHGLGARPHPPILLDPAMGTGVFLLAALRAMHEQWGTPPDTLAETHLYGADLDLLAIRVAALGLALETGARSDRIAAHLVRADLQDAIPPSLPDPDIVIGNPPWGSGTGNRREGTDRFASFLDLGARLTHGTLGMVVPRAMLLQTAHRAIRSSLLERMAPHRVILLGDRLFTGATAPACAIVLGPKPGDETLSITDHRVPRRPLTYSIPTSRWTVEGFGTEGGPMWALLERLHVHLPTLGDVGARYRIRDGGLNYSDAAVGARALYRADTSEDSRDLPVYRGRDFARYTPIQRSAWLRHDAVRGLQPGERLTYSHVLLAAPEKIVLRQTADRLIGTLDRSGMVMGRSAIAIVGSEDASLPALLACLNSRLLTALYRVLADEQGRVLPQVKVARVRALPLPDVASHRIPPDSIGREAEVWQRLHALALRQLSRGAADPTLDGEIDDIVERLYGLTPTERALLGERQRDGKHSGLVE